MVSSPSALRGAFPFYGVQVSAKPPEHLIAIGVVQFSFEFVQSEVDYVVVMDLQGRNVITEFQPNAVQQVDFLGREVRRVRAQVEDVLLSAREVDH